MAETCVFCGKKFGMASMPMRVTPKSGAVMCRKCQLEYKNPLVEIAKAQDTTKIAVKVEQIKKATGNNTAELEALLKVIIDEASVLSEEEYAKQQELKKEQEPIRKEFERIRNIPITTEDLKCTYKIIAPIIFNTTNRGVFTSVYDKLSSKYSHFPYDILLVKPENESLSGSELGITPLSLFDTSLQFEGKVGQDSFDRAFYIALAELRLRAAEMGADAIIGMKMDFDLDTTNFGAFYLQMYGTAVKLLEER